MTTDLVPTAWLVQYPGCDGSADWCEIGASEPADIDDAVASPLYTMADIDAAVAKERARAVQICRDAAIAARCSSSGVRAKAAISMASTCSMMIQLT